jgi:hypothetical protein
VCVSHTSVISHRRTSEHWINFQANIIKNITYIHIVGYYLLTFFSQTEIAKHLTTSVISTVCQTLLLADVCYPCILGLGYGSSDSTYCFTVLRLGVVFVLLTVWDHKSPWLPLSYLHKGVKLLRIFLHENRAAIRRSKEY